MWLRVEFYIGTFRLYSVRSSGPPEQPPWSLQRIHILGQALRVGRGY